MDATPRPKHRRTVYVYGLAGNLRHVLVRGNPLRDWLKAEGIPAMWSPSRKGWDVRTERVGDLIARAELAGYTVRLMGPLVAGGQR